jgi:DNA repair protein RAD50
MASVDKLSIRGVRSFSPDRECVIKFYKPLTVIYGMNGCGKTTIIECLKYSCTGTLPPGSKSGQSFIHDPKLADLTEVKAQIKLRFQNRAGIPTTVIRSLQLTQLKKSMRFKALDAVIQTIHKGQKQSLTQRCAEVDNMIPQLMGVKKAVLDNVIFCHQEDSNWPLQEGTALKKKFDDIFESTRYTKALKVISDERKKQRNQMKDLERDLSLIKARAQNVQMLVRERDECKEKREDIAEKISKYETIVKECEDRLDVLQAELDKVRALESEEVSCVL